MPFTIRRVSDPDAADLRGLTDVLVDCVDGGASVSFMQPLDRARAEVFWDGVAAAVRDETRVLLIADDGEGVVGTVQLLLDLPENQPHRADVAKMLVHRRARGQGIGEALMRAAEDAARSCGRWLLVLDTVTGSTADRLYSRLGWTRVGAIPDYALWPDGGYCETTVFYRRLDPCSEVPTG